MQNEKVNTKLKRHDIRFCSLRAKYCLLKSLGHVSHNWGTLKNGPTMVKSQKDRNGILMYLLSLCNLDNLEQQQNFGERRFFLTTSNYHTDLTFAL